jgi:hypothetical protein
LREEFLFSDIVEDDLIRRDLLRNQITHLHIHIINDNSETVTNTFALILSLCEQLTELVFTDTYSGYHRLTPDVFLLHKNFHSSSLIKLKINVSNIYDCFFLLDGRLISLSTLIINVADIFYAPIDILEEVTFEKSIVLNGDSFFFCLEKTSQIEIFLFHFIWFHRQLRHSGCSIASSNDQSRNIEITSDGI